MLRLKGNVLRCLKIAMLLLFVVFLVNYYIDYNKNNDSSTKPKHQKFRKHDNLSNIQPKQITQQQLLEKITLSPTVSDVLKYQKQEIADDMQDYEYPNGKFNVKAKNLQELTSNSGGTPMRSVIVTTWRSGSSFLGGILNAVPGTFYTYEPLVYLNKTQIRGPPNDKEPLNTVKNILNCNYSKIDDFLKLLRINDVVFRANEYFWSKHDLFPKFCFEPKFLEQFCKLFPLQSMKLVRLRMKVAASLLMDPSLNVRIVLLIRDPRGVHQSRKHCPLCVADSDCFNTTSVCMDMVSDYQEAVELIKKFPKTLKVVRYEDLSLKPYETAREILQFYGLPFDKKVREYLDTHTKASIGERFSLYRDSKANAYNWTKLLLFNETKIIQDGCEEALKLWGYKKALNAKELENFNPILPFTKFDVNAADD